MTFYEHMAIAARTYLVDVLEQYDGRGRASRKAAGMTKDCFYGALRQLGLHCQNFRPPRTHGISRGFKVWISLAVHRGANERANH